MSYFTLLFGDLSEMPSYHSLYQRLLAFDDTEALEILDRHFEQDNPSTVFDRVLAPLFLRLALDRKSSFVDEEQTEFVYRTIGDHVANMARKIDAADADSVTETANETTPDRRELRILVVPTGDEPEDIMGEVLRLTSRQELNRDVELTGSSLLTNEILERIESSEPDAVVFCCSTVGSQTKVRAVCKRLQRSHRGFPVYVWQAHDAETVANRPNRHLLDIDGAFSSVDDVVQQLAKVNRRVEKTKSPNTFCEVSADQAATVA